MSWKLTLVLLLGILASVNSSESTLKGEVYVHSSSNTRIIAQFTPLSQQPKVANIKNSLFEFLLLTDSQSCGELNKKDFTNDLPVIVVIDFTQVKQPACGMTNKIANIKNAGGYGLFIVTDQRAFSLNHCRMYDSNSFLTAVMDRNNYLKLTMNQVNSMVLGQITISLKDSKLKLLQIWTSSLNAATYDNVILLGKIFDRLPTLKEGVVWTPRIATLGCTHGDNPNICTTAEFVASCGCKGEFCSPQTHEKTPEILIKEDIRQLKIFTQYPSKYFEYIQIFKKQCFQGYSKQKYSQECATYVMNKLGIDSQSINKVISDFVDKCAVEEQAKLISSSELYTTFEKDKRAFVNYGRYPLLLLNKQILQYKNQDDLAGQLCRKLQLQDQGCFQVKSTTVVTTTSTGVLFYVLLIILLVAIGAGVVYFYRKKLKKDMNKQIKMQVSTAVEHYFALTDVK